MSVPVRLEEPPERSLPAVRLAAAEPVHVRIRVERGSEIPDLMLWADRLWAVHRVIARQIVGTELVGALAEHVWWVEVRAGRSGPTRVCELRQSYPGGHWRLCAVVDEVPNRLRPAGGSQVVGVDG